jgi:fluoride ion exporter CrcB/FEX
MLRHGVNRASLAYLGPAFPFGTLFVNIAGGMVMGVMAELFLVKGGGSQGFACSSLRGFSAASRPSRLSASTRP